MGIEGARCVVELGSISDFTEESRSTVNLPFHDTVTPRSPCLLVCTVLILVTFLLASHCLPEVCILSLEHFNSFPQIQNLMGAIS